MRDCELSPMAALLFDTPSCELIAGPCTVDGPDWLYMRESWLASGCGCEAFWLLPWTYASEAP